MKKIITLCLAALLLFSLFACSNNNNSSNSSGGNNTPAGSPTNESPSAPASNSTGDSAASASPAATGGGRVGYMDDDVDHFARDKYEIAYVYSIDIPIHQQMAESFGNLGSKYNYNFTAYSAQADTDTFISLLEVCIDQGMDGVIVAPFVEVYRRVYEVLDEAGMPFAAPLTPYRDDQDRNMMPAVIFDGYEAGVMLADWLLDNYKDFFGDIDLSKAGVLTVSLLIDKDIRARADGGRDRYLERVPGMENMIVEMDMSDTVFSIQGAFDKAATIFAANSDKEYWFIISGSEEWGIGALRAAESIGLADKTVLATVGSAFAFGGEWEDPANSPSWRVLVPENTDQFAATLIPGLIALIDGRATFDTLWINERAPGDFATISYLNIELATRDNYKDYIAKSDALYR